MVNIVVYLEDNKYKGFQIEGHTEYEEKGKDIICSGISAIAQTAALGLKKYTYEFTKIEIWDGLLRCIVDLENLNYLEDIRVQTVIDTMLLGLENLQESYKDYMKITKEVY